MDENNLYALNWSNHTNHIRLAFESLFSKNELVDVTLTCEGKKVGAHKVLLSACSTYFLNLFRDNPCQHPIVILKDVRFQNLMHILQFIYNGEVSVATENLDHFLKTAELLQISGLTDSENESAKSIDNQIIENSPSSKPDSITEKSSKGHRQKKRQSLEEDLNNSRLEGNTCYKKKRENESQIDVKIKLEGNILDVEEGEQARTPENFDDGSLEEDTVFQRKEISNDLQASIKIKQEHTTILDVEEEHNQRESVFEIDKQNETISIANTFQPETSPNLCVNTIQNESSTPKRSLHTFLKPEGAGRKKRKMCIGCYKKQRKTLSSKEAFKRTRKVISYCENCKNKPGYCLPCFNECHKQ